MSATMTQHTSGIDLQARRKTAERLWQQHTHTSLWHWVNPSGYTLRADAYRNGGVIGTLTIRAAEVSYTTRYSTLTPQEQAAVRAIRAALIGGGS